jgi:hypothetical protein
VNGFSSGRAFDLAPEGMTIFFGHNGAGKSGYACVFENACKPRHRVDVRQLQLDRHQQILPFWWMALRKPHVWSRTGRPHLSSVSVYDAACANDSIDADGTPAYQLYGLTHLARLVLLQREALERLATRLEQAQRRGEETQRWVNDRAVPWAKELITKQKTAHLAMQLAQARLPVKTY